MTKATAPPGRGAWWANRADPKNSARLWTFPAGAERDLLAVAGLDGSGDLDDAARLIEEVEHVLRQEPGARGCMDEPRPAGERARQAGRVMHAVDDLEAALEEAGMLTTLGLERDLAAVYAEARESRDTASREPARHRPTRYALRHVCAHLARIFNVRHRNDGRSKTEIQRARRDFVGYALEAAEVPANADAIAKTLRGIPLTWVG